MQGVTDFLVKVDTEYESSIKINKQTLLLTSIFEDPFQLVKSAVVVSRPIAKAEIKADKGDVLWFSHLILRRGWDANMGYFPSDYLVNEKEKIYRVPQNMIYAYIHNEQFIVPEPFIFVKPIERGLKMKGK